MRDGPDQLFVMKNSKKYNRTKRETRGEVELKGGKGREGGRVRRERGKR